MLSPLEKKFDSSNPQTDDVASALKQKIQQQQQDPQDEKAIVFETPNEDNEPSNVLIENQQKNPAAATQVFQPSHGTLRYCKVHDFSENINVTDPKLFECVKTAAASDLKICLFPTNQDIWVSGGIRQHGGWELGWNKAIMDALTKYPNAAFLDIGANIGMHSLVAAKKGHQVVAVEPKLETIQRLHKSVNLNNLQERFTLVKNGISDVRTNLTLYADDKNQGGSSIVSHMSGKRQTIETIIFDDLLEVFPRKEAVLKIDIEAAEPQALNVSRAFFQAVNVRIIFMEWMQLRDKYFLGINHDKAGRNQAIAMTDYLRSFGFVPKIFQPNLFQSTNTSTSLFEKPMNQWPNDIIWFKNWLFFLKIGSYPLNQKYTMLL